jgi:cellulose synthase (UDP-forming)
MITLCVPSHESASVIRDQLAALVGVSYPHDSWILDEGNSPEVRALAAEWGVRYFSRRGVALWNQKAPPFQRSTKAGNVNAWLDHVASLELEYDGFVQLDIDHRPRADYLDRTLGYFRDPAVAWVQAPSVCGNLDNWAARGLSEQDLVFHGPLQMAFYGASRTPFIIGSHTTYRMSAIREIGGFQPTRAEDHLDTVVLAAHGYEGVFVPELIAVGDGPDGFRTYLRQQFAWAHSMIQIFLRHTPGLVRRYSLRQAFQFLFCQSWYTLWSISLAVLWVLPTVALLSHRSIASVKLGDFLLYFVPVMLVSSLMWSETRRWFQPTGVRLSWRGIVLSVARWPVVLWALLNVVFRVKRPYMITPKGQQGQAGNGAVLYGPGLALAGVPLVALWVFYGSAGSGAIQGYYGLVLINAAIGLAVVGTTVLAEISSLAHDHGLGSALRSRSGVALTASALVMLLAFSTVTVWNSMVGAIA